MALVMMYQSALSLKGGFAEKMVAWCAELVIMPPALSFHPDVM